MRIILNLAACSFILMTTLFAASMQNSISEEEAMRRITALNRGYLERLDRSPAHSTQTTMMYEEGLTPFCNTLSGVRGFESIERCRERIAENLDQLR